MYVWERKTEEAQIIIIWIMVHQNTFMKFDPVYILRDKLKSILVIANHKSQQTQYDIASLEKKMRSMEGTNLMQK